jgi:hypothetical protein
VALDQIDPEQRGHPLSDVCSLRSWFIRHCSAPDVRGHNCKSLPVICREEGKRWSQSAQRGGRRGDFDLGCGGRGSGKWMSGRAGWSASGGVAVSPMHTCDRNPFCIAWVRRIETFTSHRTGNYTKVIGVACGALFAVTTLYVKLAFQNSAIVARVLVSTPIVAFTVRANAGNRLSVQGVRLNTLGSGNLLRPTPLSSVRRDNRGCASAIPTCVAFNGGDWHLGTAQLLKPGGDKG